MSLKKRVESIEARTGTRNDDEEFLEMYSQCKNPTGEMDVKAMMIYLKTSTLEKLVSGSWTRGSLYFEKSAQPDLHAKTGGEYER